MKIRGLASCPKLESNVDLYLDLTNAIDFLCLNLSTGLSLSEAFRETRLGLSPDSAIAALFDEVLRGQDIGRSFADALLVARGKTKLEVARQFYERVLTSWESGTGLIPSLIVLAQELREEVELSWERQIARMPIKMLAPVAICILPAAVLILCAGNVSELLEMLVD